MLDLVNAGSLWGAAQCDWERLISDRQNHEVSLVESPAYQHLAEAELALMDELCGATKLINRNLSVRTLASVFLATILGCWSMGAQAYPGGIAGYSNDPNTGPSNCGSCHIGSNFTGSYSASIAKSRLLSAYRKDSMEDACYSFGRLTSARPSLEAVWILFPSWKHYLQSQGVFHLS